MAKVLDLADQWLQLDKVREMLVDPTTRAEIQSMLKQNDLEGLEDCLSTRMS
ncbi:MAG: hypothetical protein LQ337_000627 [Flavoplaca oasis]|nr:MAG: hypothetical protein LQ337_000627 [Flavoplaca oasis]